MAADDGSPLVRALPYTGLPCHRPDRRWGGPESLLLALLKILTKLADNDFPRRSDTSSEGTLCQ